MQLDDYQLKSVDDVAYKIGQGYKKIVYQLPTGAGKTVCFSYLCKRYIDKFFDKDILILVHREELLRQTRQTLYDGFGIVSSPVNPSNRHLNPARVYVGMIETCNNRLKKNENYFRNVGLVIIDECHLGSFSKIHKFFDDKVILGVTATPISASKKKPLNGIYNTIVCGVDIPFLIDFHDKNPKRGLVPCVTYGPPNVNKKELHVVGGEYDQREMSDLYSKSKHVHNTVDKYRVHALGKKTLVFNCSIEHSTLVCDAFVDAGFNARHLDSEDESEYRTECLQWFRDTPGAILCNVGILTTGFDEPSVECIIVNRSTKSLPLWLQMCGRGGRPYPEKWYFIIIDMGGNVEDHLEWSESRDWEHWFNHPDKPKEQLSGVAGIKICIECEGIIPIQAIKCKHCDALQPKREPTYDERLGEFVMITKNIDVKKLIESKPEAHNPYTTLHQIKNNIVDRTRSELGLKKLDDDTAYKLIAVYQEKVAEWCKETKRAYSMFHKTVPNQWFTDALNESFNWSPPKLELIL